MSDGTEGGTEAVRTGEVTLPESARVVLPDDAIKDGSGTLGAAEWPAGEADEPQGQGFAEEGQRDDAGSAVTGTASAESDRLRAARATDDGELTPSDPSQPIPQATPPGNLAEPLR